MFQYKEASTIFPQPIVLTYDHVPLYKSALYTNMLKEISKCVRGDRDIFDYGFYPLLEEWSYYKLKDKIRKISKEPDITTKSQIDIWNKK